MFTFPSWAQTIAGPVPPARAFRKASGRMRPCSSAATVRTRAAPKPSNRSDVKIVTWASPPTITSISGAPNSPRCSTSQLARRNTAVRAAARQVALAI